MPSHTIKTFKTGVVNRPDTEDIRVDASKASLGWVTTDGHIELVRGRSPVGAVGSAGGAQNVHIGYKTDKTSVLFAHIGDTVKYFNGTSWATITGAPTGIVGDITFANYASVAGSFVFFGGPEIGLYKIVTAIPDRAIDMSDTAKNFRGYIFIDKARMWLWGRKEDKTGLYASYIDKQDSSVYTTVTDEVIGTGNGSQTVFTGTLAFAGLSDGAKRNCFGLQFKIVDGSTTYNLWQDNYLGTISGSGVSGTISGTINYVTGTYSITFTVAPTGTMSLKMSYFHEKSSNKGIADFSFTSPTRVAGEGFFLRQDVGGDPIERFLPSSDGSYVSIKQRSSYEVRDRDGDDKVWLNDILRTNIGLPYKGAVTTTDKGVVFINTAQPLRPELTILERDPIGNVLEPKNIGEHFAWENYEYDTATMGVYGQFVVLSCKTAGALVNDITLLIKVGKQAVVEPAPYGVTSWAVDGSTLYGGSPLTQTVYRIFNTFSDEDEVIENYWEERDEDYGSKRLKKFLRVRLRGFISRIQKVDIEASYDRKAYEKIGELDGGANYVDMDSVGTVGDDMIGSVQIGGEGVTTYGYYEMQLTRLYMPRFKTVSLRFVARGIGYVTIDEIIHEEILTYEDRIATRFR